MLVCHYYKLINFFKNILFKIERKYKEIFCSVIYFNEIFLKNDIIQTIYYKNCLNCIYGKILLRRDMPKIYCNKKHIKNNNFTKINSCFHWIYKDNNLLKIDNIKLNKLQKDKVKIIQKLFKLNNNNSLYLELTTKKYHMSIVIFNEVERKRYRFIIFYNKKHKLYDYLHITFEITNEMEIEMRNFTNESKNYVGINEIYLMNRNNIYYSYYIWNKKYKKIFINNLDKLLNEIIIHHV